MKTFAVRVFKNELKINFPYLVLHFLKHCDKLISIRTRLFMKETNGMACERSVRRLLFCDSLI